MAIGDDAAAAGMDLCAGTDKRYLGFEEINKSRDYIATQPIDAARITSGTLATARVPSLDASKITSGTLSTARLPFTVTASADPDTVVERSTGGRTNVGTPLYDSNAVTKAYCDANGQADRVTPAAYVRTSGAVKYAMWMDANYDIVRNTSSRRYKDDIRPAEVDIEAVLDLEPVTYHLKADADRSLRELGLIAEDSTGVEHLVVHEVQLNKDGTPRKGAKPRPEAVRYEQALPVALLAVVKHQAQQIADLAARVEKLEER